MNASLSDNSVLAVPGDHSVAAALQYLDVHQCVGRGRITAIQQIFRLLKV